VSEAVGAEAFDLIARIHASAEPSIRDQNPIGILSHMARNEDVRLCPLIYGYVNYTRPDAGGHPIAFTDAPAIVRGGRPGSTLGGTGIGISRRCEVTPELLTHLRWLLGDEAQRRFIPANDGQPSRRSAWHDPDVNAAWGNFYAMTARTLEAAYVRPRYPGYIAMQAAASAYLREALADREQGAVVARRLNRMHTEYAGAQTRRLA
jgi:multiple sugar transport system substrate-binding protein